MTTAQAPGWIRITVGLVGAAGLVLSAVCFLAADVIFGTDAFRTLARVPIGLLGATWFGIGAMAIVAALQARVLVLQFAARTLFLATALAPMVFVYNIRQLPHEMMHVEDVRHFSSQYVDTIASVPFRSDAECREESSRLIAAFGDRIREFALRSNLERHPILRAGRSTMPHVEGR